MEASGAAASPSSGGSVSGGEAPPHLLVCVDASECAERAFRRAVGMVRGRGGTLDLVHVTEIAETSLLDPFHDVLDHIYNVEQRQLAATVRSKYEKLCGEAGIPFRLTNVEHAKPKDFICKHAEGLPHLDLIVTGSRGLGAVERVVLGSVSEHLVAHAPCPVLVVR